MNNEWQPIAKTAHGVIRKKMLLIILPGPIMMSPFWVKYTPTIIANAIRSNKKNEPKPILQALSISNICTFRLIQKHKLWIKCCTYNWASMNVKKKIASYQDGLSFNVYKNFAIKFLALVSTLLNVHYQRPFRQ